ncbi:MAG: cobalamin biosynthesis protein, partial [Chloroflexota bacterium]|nr:cobalamin biosynthesis protein [Chloroflexota bacterium]
MPPDSPPAVPALVAVSEHGRRLAAYLQGRLIEGPARQALEQAWRESDGIVFFGPLGVAVRLVAPLLGNKHSDPAVVVVDDAGRHAVSLVSGHEGGANDLARHVALQLGAEPVITTAGELLRRDLVLGIGCSSGTSEREIERLARAALAEVPASFESVARVATIDAKAHEPGLLEFAERWHLPVRYFSARQLTAMDAPNPSVVVEQAVGTASVAEAAALAAAGERGRLIVEKRKSVSATAAVAREVTAGQLSIIGIGPGGREQLTLEAMEALRQADVVVAYSTYVDIVRGWLPAANCLGLPIGDEIERCRRAIELARQGKSVALVCSGDAGIYGLAGLVYE